MVIKSHLVAPGAQKAQKPIVEYDFTAVTITMLKRLLLPAGGALLLLQYLLLVTTLPLPQETHLRSILDQAETCKARPAAKVEDSPPQSIEVEQSRV